MSHLIFVYGTLKTGEPNFHLMTKETVGTCVLKGLARTVNKYPLVIASQYNIPFMLAEEDKGHNVLGELYEVDADQLAHLDQLECHPRFYERQEIEVEMVDKNDKDSRIKALAYMLVKFRDSLLDLPMFDSYTDLIDGKKFVSKKERDKEGPLWWYEVHKDYKEQSNGTGIKVSFPIK